MRRYVFALGLLLMAVAAGIAWFDRTSFRHARSQPTSISTAESVHSQTEVLPVTRSAPVENSPRGASPGAEARSRRDALRQEILRRVPLTASGAAPSVAAAPPGQQTYDVENKLGAGRDQLVSFLNKEFMPLAAECIEQAQERRPELSGVLAIGLKTIAAKEIGAIVETADPTDGNEVPDAELLGCIRESAFSLTIPQPLVSGQESFELTLQVGARLATAPR